MPSPFNEKNVPQQQPEVVLVTDSSLYCDACGDMTDEGEYYESKQLLVFTCHNGHRNEVKIAL